MSDSLRQTANSAYRAQRPTKSGTFTAADVSTLVSWPALKIKPVATTMAALNCMDHNAFHHLLVLEQGRLVGILCRCDLLDARASDEVAAYMSQHVVWVPGDTRLTRAESVMDMYGVNALPVFDGGAWGILTRGDLVRAGRSEHRCCDVCGEAHHVRPHPLYDEQRLCRDCRSGTASELTRGLLDLG